ncbi:hypothetical protein LXL04_000408 [Taraxacum kok-saghyz]
MGRGRGKAKKNSIMAREDGSGEEEKMPAKRRGRPTKQAQKEEEEESEKMDYENKETKGESLLENGNNKRKKQSLEGDEIIKDDTNGDVLTKAVGFRQNGSRRKNKPHRAAEVGVSACEVCSWVALRS